MSVRRGCLDTQLSAAENSGTQAGATPAASASNESTK